MEIFTCIIALILAVGGGWIASASGLQQQQQLGAGAGAANTNGRIHVRVERIFPQVSPERGKEAWLEYQWRQGGGLLGTLVIPEEENNINRRRRRILPVGIEEELAPEEESEGISLRYKVTDLGLFSTELVPYSHRASVIFQRATSDNDATKMIWEVDCEARNRKDFWQAFTQFNIEAVSDNLASYLLPPIKYTRTTKLRINVGEFISSKEVLSNEWVDFVWKRGGGLPVPSLNLDKQRRIVIPPFLVERLISSSDDGQIEYTVDNPGLLTYPVHTHQGRVHFEPSDVGNEELSSAVQPFDMIWEVDIRPMNGLDWLVKPFTAAIISTISRNFKAHLLEPKAKVQLSPPRGGKGQSFGEVSKNSWLGGVLAAHLEDRRSTMEQTIAMLQPWTWGRSPATDEVGEIEEWTQSPTVVQDPTSPTTTEELSRPTTAQPSTQQQQQQQHHDAMQAALEASKTHGAQSPQARVLWEIAEEIEDSIYSPCSERYVYQILLPYVVCD